jgi:Zn-dependent M28 family amino/carboxypeptidase
VFLSYGCSLPGQTEDTTFNGGRALEHVEKQVSLGPRTPGSDAHIATADYIRETLEGNGWTVDVQEFTFNGIEARNIIGRAGPETGRWIILGTHYDTRPLADRDLQSPDQPVMGANDGASGVAVLLELSHVIDLKTLDERIWIVFFDVEDSGGIDENPWAYGSQYFANSLDRYPEAVVIVDMVGDVELNILFERNSDIELSAKIWAIAKDNGYTAFIPEPGRSILDDHTAFLRLGMRAIDIIDFDYPYWHTTQDTLDKVSAESLKQVGRTLQLWLDEENPLADLEQ